MKLIYDPADPADGERVEYDYDPERVRQSEAEAAQGHYQGTWAQLQIGVNNGDVRALRVLLWTLMRRTTIHARLKYGDVPDFFTGEVRVERSVAELTVIRDRIQQTDGLGEALLEATLAVANREIDEAKIRDGIDLENVFDDPASGTEGGHRALTKGEVAAGIDPLAHRTSPDIEHSVSDGGPGSPNSGESSPGNSAI